MDGSEVIGKHKKCGGIVEVSWVSGHYFHYSHTHCKKCKKVDIKDSDIIMNKKEPEPDSFRSIVEQD